LSQGKCSVYKTTVQFVITADGKARNVVFTESTLNDRILEYELARIIRTVGYGPTGTAEGAMPIMKKLAFGSSGK
jgi:hypothetical protein